MMPETLALLLHRCSKTKAFYSSLSLHATAIKKGFHGDIRISNHIINAYGKCGKISFARQLFDEMRDKNLVTWSAMISGYVQSGKHQFAQELYSRLPFQPNEFILASVIASCTGLAGLRLGECMHGCSLKLGYSSVSFVSNSLISLYMKRGQCDDALLLFSSLSEPSSVSFNAMITGLIANGKPGKGFEWFKNMCREGLVPDCFTFLALLGGCDDAVHPNRGIILHCQAIKFKLDSTALVGNALISIYSKSGTIEDAEVVFRCITEKDVISWNTIIAACSHCDEHCRALSFFRHMMGDIHINPDDFSYSSALAASAGLASLRHGREIHAHLIKTRLDWDIGVSNALINMYAKCGCIGYASGVFTRINYHNLVSWNSMIAALAYHGLARKAIDLYKRMQTVNLKPDSVTFLGLLTACNHAGLVNEGKTYFTLMDESYGISPGIEHFSCLIDLLGRAGKLNEAEKYLEKHGTWQDPIVLGSLLSACRLHGHVSTAEQFAGKLLANEPVSSSPYVLLANLYASEGGMHESVAEARKMLKCSGLKKEPGHSIIDINGSVRKFTVGDISNSWIKDTVDALINLSRSEEDEFSFL